MTPTFLYIVQFIFSYVFLMLLVMGEMHKPVPILLCFPLLMSRVGRGIIILMVSLPITNFNEAVCAIIAIICSLIGILNMMLGCRDGQVELTYAKDGVPESGSATTSTAAPAALKPYEGVQMNSMAGASPSPPIRNMQGQIFSPPPPPTMVL